MTTLLLALFIALTASTAKARMAARCSERQTPSHELHCGKRNLHHADSLKRFLVAHPWAGSWSERVRLRRDARWLKRYGLKHIEIAKARMVPAGMTAAWAWYWRRDTQCEVSHEGGWTSVSKGGTYAGRFQMDYSFETSKSFGRSMERRYGRANNWPHWAQVLHAYDVWLDRGWSPWPPYYRFGCGG